MNPYQPIIDWLHTEEGERWSEQRMQHAYFEANRVDRSMGWHPNNAPYAVWKMPIYLGGVLSVKEDYYDTAAEEAAAT